MVNGYKEKTMIYKKYKQKIEIQNDGNKILNKIQRQNQIMANYEIRNKNRIWRKKIPSPTRIDKNRNCDPSRNTKEEKEINNTKTHIYIDLTMILEPSYKTRLAKRTERLNAQQTIQYKWKHQNKEMGNKEGKIESTPMGIKQVKTEYQKQEFYRKQKSQESLQYRLMRGIWRNM